MQQVPANKRSTPAAQAVRRLLHALPFICICALPWPNAGAAADELQSEYRIKAAFLYNFARFTNWPSADQRDFTLCVLGESPFHGELDELAGKPVHEQPLQVSYPATAEEAAHCQLIFISDTWEPQLDSAIEALASQAILSVSDINGFINHGGIIGLRTLDNKVRFEINIEAAAGAGLSISSKLLSLATTIRAGQ